MKKIIALLLALSMMVFLLTSCEEEEVPKDSITYQTKATTATSESTKISATTESTDITETTVSTEETKPNHPIVLGEANWVQTSVFQKGWRYLKIDLSNCKHQISKSVLTATQNEIDKIVTKLFGYQKGCYEYDYFYALIGLSQYASMADYRIFEEPMLDNNLVDDFLENHVDPAYFQEPYQEILYASFSILKEADVGLVPINSWSRKYGTRQGEYCNIYYADYQYHPVEWSSRLGLLFSDFDKRFEEYADILLTLSEKYPAYSGEFTVTESMKEAARSIIQKSETIPAVRDQIMPKWGTYFNMRNERTETDIQCELIPEKSVIKITLTSENNGFSFDYGQGAWVEDFNGILSVDEHGNKHYIENGANPSPAVMYMPLKYYHQHNGDFYFRVCDASQNEYEKYVKLSVDLTVQKGNPIDISDSLLDAALKEQFGEGYTDLDIAKVRELFISYFSSGNERDESDDKFRTPTVTFVFHDEFTAVEGTEKSYRYIDLFGTNFIGEPPLALKDDIMKFPCLEAVGAMGYGTNIHSLFTKEELDHLLN